MMIITEKRRKPKSERRRRKKRMKTGSRGRCVRDARLPPPAPTKSFPYPHTLPSSYSPTPTGSPRISPTLSLINQTIILHFPSKCSSFLNFVFNYFFFHVYFLGYCHILLFLFARNFFFQCRQFGRTEIAPFAKDIDGYKPSLLPPPLFVCLEIHVWMCSSVHLLLQKKPAPSRPPIVLHGWLLSEWTGPDDPPAFYQQYRHNRFIGNLIDFESSFSRH